MSGPEFFSLRRLSPFRGTIQVVELTNARAFSLDGLGWTIQLRSQRPVRKMVWGNLGPAEFERRYFTFARWSDGGELARVPIDPSLGDQSRHPALTPLLDALSSCPTLPFRQTDHLELWLLDKDSGLPVALVQSATGSEPPRGRHELAWRALPAEDRGFHSPRLVKEAPDDKVAQNGSRHGTLLEQLITRTAGQPARRQWFRRGPKGEGVACGDIEPAGTDPQRELAVGAFPELLVREAWPQAHNQALVEDYLSWQAPALLTLAHLRRETRERLEHAASRRATVLYRYHRLIPEIVNQAVLRPALVEAVIRKSA